jgi:hypothetical protein
MTTFAEVIRAAIPNADEDTCEYILWNRTPYPMGRVTARTLYKAARGSWRADKNGIRLCDHCDKPAVNEQWECAGCRSALDVARSA